MVLNTETENYPSHKKSRAPYTDLTGGRFQHGLFYRQKEQKGYILFLLFLFYRNFCKEISPRKTRGVFKHNNSPCSALRRTRKIIS